MKIAHISDIHINVNASRLGKLKFDNKGRNPVYINRLAILDDCILTALAKGCEAIILTGDIFDKDKPFPQDYQDLYNILNPIKDKIYMLFGNHDEMTSKGSGLGPIRDMGFNVSLKPEIVYLNGVSVVMAPWGTTLDQIAELGSQDNDLLAYHAGVKSKEYQWVEVDGETGNVHIEDLMKLGFKGVLLGHHHGQCNLVDNIWYAGSPECYNFGEEKDKKGFLIWDVSCETIKIEQINTNHLFPEYKTFTPIEFLSLEDKGINAYVRIKGEVSEEDRIEIIKKMKEFECLDYTYELISKTKSKRVARIKGTSEDDILTNYFKENNIENIKELLELHHETRQ